MIIKRVGFCRILSDNEEKYYSLLEGVINSVDNNSSMQITKKPESINIRIFPSHPKYLQTLVGILNSMNNLFGIKVSYSKSIKSSSAINFDIMDQLAQSDLPPSSKASCSK